MPLAWSCEAFPAHGSFLQSGIARLQDGITDFQRGIGKAQRFACPRCCAEGLPGWVRPAEAREIDKLATEGAH